MPLMPLNVICHIETQPEIVFLINLWPTVECVVGDGGLRKGNATQYGSPWTLLSASDTSRNPDGR